MILKWRTTKETDNRYSHAEKTWRAESSAYEYIIEMIIGSTASVNVSVHDRRGMLVTNMLANSVEEAMELAYQHSQQNVINKELETSEKKSEELPEKQIISCKYENDARDWLINLTHLKLDVLLLENLFKLYNVEPPKAIIELQKAVENVEKNVKVVSVDKLI